MKGKCRCRLTYFEIRNPNAVITLLESYPRDTKDEFLNCQEEDGKCHREDDIACVHKNDPALNAGVFATCGLHGGLSLRSVALLI